MFSLKTNGNKIRLKMIHRLGFAVQREPFLALFYSLYFVFGAQDGANVFLSRKIVI